jgi:hypothetical protein
MKAHTKILLLTLFFASKSVADPTNDTPAHWGAVSEGFHLGIRLEKQKIAIGDSMPVDAVLQNVSATNLVIGNDRAGGTGGAFYDGYGIVVSKGTNQLSSLVKRRTDPFSSDIFAGSSGFTEVAPRDIRHHTIRVDQEFDIKTPGTYTVYVTRKVRKLQGKGSSEIKSEAATFEVVSDTTESQPKK